uniref:Velvet domain-containing protein n=1 Tax=Mycena chlorophos TaxID=658473 RepID=A0ABQ0KVU4_MYCCL|nr:predicted protein [Mycena chlorophos]
MPFDAPAPFTVVPTAPRSMSSLPAHHQPLLLDTQSCVAAPSCPQPRKSSFAAIFELIDPAGVLYTHLLASFTHFPLQLSNFLSPGRLCCPPASRSARSPPETRPPRSYTIRIPLAQTTIFVVPIPALTQSHLQPAKPSIPVRQPHRRTSSAVHPKKVPPTRTTNLLTADEDVFISLFQATRSSSCPSRLRTHALRKCADPTVYHGRVLTTAHQGCASSLHAEPIEAGHTTVRSTYASVFGAIVALSAYDGPGELRSGYYYVLISLAGPKRGPAQSVAEQRRGSRASSDAQVRRIIAPQPRNLARCL